MKPVTMWICRAGVLALAVGVAWVLWAALGGPALDHTAVGLVALCTSVAIAALSLRAAAAGRPAAGVRENLVLLALMVVAVGPLPRLLALWFDVSITKSEQLLGALLGTVLALIPAGFEYLALSDGKR